MGKEGWRREERTMIKQLVRDRKVVEVKVKLEVE